MFLKNLPQKSGDRIYFGNLIGSSSSFLISEIVEKFQGLVVLITENQFSSQQHFSEIHAISNENCMIFPDNELLPFDPFSPSNEIISERLLCLSQLKQMKKGVFILPVASLMQKVSPENFIFQNVFSLKKGMIFSRESFRVQLEKAGYHAVNQVMEHGEFAVRGALFDLFPMGANVPLRIDFFDKEIDSIRTFDINSQRTIKQIDEIQLLPAKEFPIDEKGIETFRKNWRARFEIQRTDENIYQQISKNIIPQGIEFWQPLFFDEPLQSLFDYFPQNTLILCSENLQNAAKANWQTILNRHESFSYDIFRPLLEPNELWLKEDEIFAKIKQFPAIYLSKQKLEQKSNKINLPFDALPNLKAEMHYERALKKLQFFEHDFDGKCVFFAESEGRKEILQNLFQKNQIRAKTIQKFNEIYENTNKDNLVKIGFCAQGFLDLQNKIAFIGENDLFEIQIKPIRKRNSALQNVDSMIKSLAELEFGQPIVHVQHGIGRYEGLITLETGNVKAEYLLISYANDAKLYVPISALNMVSQYVGASAESAPLHRLGTESWSKAREKAAEKAKDIAAELLDIYAQRNAKQGFAFQQDLDLYHAFCQSFPYELTPDQKKTINQVVLDMVQKKPMDRLICGDVGFGKTEIAIRAAFLAALNKKQVAILVPTTLLAQQHFENFLERFANWPIRIGVLSRFQTTKEQKLLIDKMESGKIDIVIGTHKLLNEKIKWHDLGLLIIDEEHRFGVKQKEKIKSARANIDILTLTATPIPRTLNMSLHGIRDLSIISTPPARRLPIKTFVREYDELIIKEAILRETLRGGQVYYLFNDVSQIENTKIRLQQLIPNVEIAIAHGQMHERELERIMEGFHRKRYSILLCTTIIETGIDIPSANTIIIERADKLGLAQLHQIRGRVGRSHHQAYAYLLTPPIKLLNSDAKKRLDAIASFEELGAGFLLASQDLEIRGAGEILGEEQSGQITTIGFNLYLELLENAVKSLQNNQEPSLENILKNQQTEIELRLPALIPENYISDVNLRLSLYKQIASAKTLHELEEIKVEMIDRFGLLTNEIKNLFLITEFRQRAESLGINKIELNANGGKIEFSKQNKIDFNYLLSLIQQKNSIYKLDGEQQIKIICDLKNEQKRKNFVEELIKNFEHNQQNA